MKRKIMGWKNVINMISKEILLFIAIFLISLQIKYSNSWIMTINILIKPKNNVNASFLVYPFFMSKTVNNVPIIKADIEVSLLKHI